jgi:predicted transcriptional regulator YdeE
MTTTINLTQEPETIDFPTTHYVFIERIGNIPTNAPQAWQTVEKFAAALTQQNQITGAAAFYKPAKGIYRGGKYARFTLTGPFDQLPEANSRAFGIVAEKRIPLRDDFNVEHYLTDPRTTPADQNVTALLFPIV